MRNRKKIIIILLGLLCLITSTTYTYSYFVVNQKVQNSVNLSIGTINSNFITVDGKTPYSSAIVNISGLIPEASQSFDFSIKNTGTLTSKLALYFDNFNGDGANYILPYLSYRLEIGSNSYEGRFSDLAITTKYFQLMDNKESPTLLKKDDMIKGKITFKLDKNTPYTAQNRTLKFNLSIYATQPNDPNWVN